MPVGAVAHHHSGVRRLPSSWIHDAFPEFLILAAVSVRLGVILETAELVPGYRRLDPDAPRAATPTQLSRSGVVSIIAGAMMLLVAVLYPSPYLAGPVWPGGFPAFAVGCFVMYVAVRLVWSGDSRPIAL